MEYTFKQPEKKTTLEKIKFKFKRLAKNLKRGLITAAGVLTALMALFSGQIFTMIVVAGLTYYFWKNSDGVDELVGTEKVREAF